MLWKSGIISLIGVLGLAHVAAQNITQEQALNAKRTISIGIILFPGFEPLDVYGPLGILYELSSGYKIVLSTIAHNTGPISARIPQHSMNMPNEPVGPLEDFGYTLGPSTVATHTFLDAPALDVILVPGGYGNLALVQKNDTSIEDFLIRRAPFTEYVLSVCTGAVHLARAGLLNHQRATTNKGLWAWVTTAGASYKAQNITWVPSARWVENEKVWTSSGVAAGMDLTYAWIKKVYGQTGLVRAVMNGIEYAPHTDRDWDPFSVVHDVPGADRGRSLESCVRPVV